MRDARITVDGTGRLTPDNSVQEAEVQRRAQLLAQQIVADTAAQDQLLTSGRIFTRFNPSTDIIENQKTLVTSVLFSNQSGSISTMFTSSNQSDTSKQYYNAIYKDNPATNASATSQFAIAYGHRLGSGSYSAGQLNDSPTKAVYSQYKQLLLAPGDDSFTFGTSGSSDLIYVINFDRSRLRDRLDPGNWQISLRSLNGASHPNNEFTGSNVVANGSTYVTLIDDSGDTDQSIGSGVSGRVYNIISGTLNAGGYITSGDYIYYGLAYPDMGMLVLDGKVLNTALSFNTVTGSSVAGDNAQKLFKSMSGSMAVNSTLYSFQARNEEVINSTHYFVRVKNGEYNFSNNPSFVTGSVGEFSQATFIGDPKTYITTIGMYNDNQELLAVAKLSQPIQKSFQNEALIKVKLDF